MGSFSLWHWLVVGILVLLLFGRGRFSEMMGDVAKGIKAFKKGMAEDEAPTTATVTPATTVTAAEPVKIIEHQPAATAVVEPVAAERKAG